MAEWQSGYARDCKSCYPSSILGFRLQIDQLDFPALIYPFEFLLQRVDGFEWLAMIDTLSCEYLKNFSISNMIALYEQHPFHFSPLQNLSIWI